MSSSETDLISTDLHGHSLYSDGRIWPEEYVRTRAEQGLSVIALSDHDTFAGVERAARAARNTGLVLVPAMEVTSSVNFGTDAAEQLHVLAYFPPSILDGGGLHQTQLWARCVRVHEKWRELVLAWVAELPEYERTALDPCGELEQLSGFEFPALQAFLFWIIQHHPVVFESFRKAHIRFWDDAELFSWTPEQLIDTIRADGGLDVVAHPNRIRDKARMARVIDYAEGIEVYTSRHKDTIAARFRQMADDQGLHWTASSDDHQQGGYRKPPCGTPRRTVERILGCSVAESLAQARAELPAQSETPPGGAEASFS